MSQPLISFIGPEPLAGGVAKQMFADQPVVWSVNRGVIIETGVLTPPNRTQTVTVRAMNALGEVGERNIRVEGLWPVAVNRGGEMEASYQLREDSAPDGTPFRVTRSGLRRRISLVGRASTRAEFDAVREFVRLHRGRTFRFSDEELGFNGLFRVEGEIQAEAQSFDSVDWSVTISTPDDQDRPLISSARIRGTQATVVWSYTGSEMGLAQYRVAGDTGWLAGSVMTQSRSITVAGIPESGVIEFRIVMQGGQVSPVIQGVRLRGYGAAYGRAYGGG
jgi:hypothetical protein